MKNKLKYVAIALLLYGSGAFNSANAITADELLVVIQNVAAKVSQAFTNIGQVLGNHEARINNLENANPNLGGYSMSFSADGAPKNVVVAKEVTPFGETYYQIRSRYATSTEVISINGVLTQRPYIANYAFVTTDSNSGAVLSVSNYIEAPDTENYVVYNVEESFYDLNNNLEKTVTDDTLREDWSLCTYGTTTICMPDVMLSSNGDHVRTYSWSSIRGLAGPLNLNGMSFDSVRLEQNITSSYSRARAFGIGEVLRAANNGAWERRAIFYRANGVTGGDLSGTPFAPGGLLEGLFF